MEKECVWKDCGAVAAGDRFIDVGERLGPDTFVLPEARLLRVVLCSEHLALVDGLAGKTNGANFGPGEGGSKSLS